MDSYWDYLPEELKDEIYKINHKSQMNEIVKDINKRRNDYINPWSLFGNARVVLSNGFMHVIDSFEPCGKMNRLISYCDEPYITVKWTLTQNSRNETEPNLEKLKKKQDKETKREKYKQNRELNKYKSKSSMSKRSK